MGAESRFGVVIIGDEILSGKRTDRHLPHVIDTLAVRGQQVAWSRVVSDRRDGLVHTLRQTRQEAVPVLCFGGIGATPDDQTRQAAGEAFGCTLARHAEAQALIERRFGAEAWPVRVRMADLPEGCQLIPNPCSGVPGFSLYRHHFFPGFTAMAWPMLDWVLDTGYPSCSRPRQERSVRVFDVAESELVGLMEALNERHPGAGLFSLPRMAAIKSVEIGFRGEPVRVEPAFSELVMALGRRALHYELANEKRTNAAIRKAAV